MNYITWEYYNSLYDNVAEDVFKRLSLRASKKLDAYARMRVKSFLENYVEEKATKFHQQVYVQIQDTMCELINLMHSQDETNVGSNLSSVSNDGYSESYKVTTTAEKETQLHDVIRAGLSGTGLAGVL